MTGAIEFLMAWKDICNKPKSCKGCPVGAACYEFARAMTDETIVELVRAVMKERRRMQNECNQVQR